MTSPLATARLVTQLNAWVAVRGNVPGPLFQSIRRYGKLAIPVFDSDNRPLSFLEDLPPGPNSAWIRKVVIFLHVAGSLSRHSTQQCFIR